MAGRANFQHCYVQEVREDEIYQISWLEETGTIVSIIVDLAKKHITTFMAFSKGSLGTNVNQAGAEHEYRTLGRTREGAWRQAQLY
jgi:phenolic acid decarboxylase